MQYRNGPSTIAQPIQTSTMEKHPASRMPLNPVAQARPTRRAFVGLAGLAAAGAALAPHIGHAAEAASDDPRPVELEADVVVVGAGGAGLVTALYCGAAGLSVAVLEKGSFAGGNTLICGGYIASGDLPQELKAKNTPEVDAYARAYIEGGPTNEDEAAVWDQLVNEYRAWEESGTDACFDSPLFNDIDYARQDGVSVAYYLGIYERTAEFLSWFMEETEAPFVPAVGIVGYSYPRFVAIEGATRGTGYIQYMQDAIERKGYPVQIRCDTQATGLVVDDDGAVTGVLAIEKDGAPLRVNARKAVVMATGGFSANNQMLAQYNTQWPYSFIRTIQTDNQPTQTGDGARMAEAAGAALGDMDTWALLPTCSPADGMEVYDDLNFLLVNEKGERFVCESGSRNDISRAIMELPEGQAYLVLDARTSQIADGTTRLGADVEFLIEEGKLVRGESLEDLAAGCGIDSDGLARTVEAWNDACRTGSDPAFGNVAVSPDYILEEPPFYVFPIAPASHITFGGIVVDDEQRALRYDRATPIEGLYAVGECRTFSGGIDFAMPDAYVAARSIVDRA